MENNLVLSKEYEAVYADLLSKVFESWRDKWGKVTSFWPMVGNAYDSQNGLMVIGRAVNGWLDSWEKGALGSSEDRSKAVRKTREGSESAAECPLSWVIKSEGRKEYNSRRSAFWRVIKKTVQTRLGDDFDEGNWPSHISWSNLTKVAPDAGGNPDDSMWTAQLPACIELLQQELQTFKPKVVLVLAGKDWYGPFLKPLGVEITQPDYGHFVEALGRRDSALWILGKHPQGKSEGDFLSEIKRALNGQ